MPLFIRRCLSSLLDLLYPPTCAACRAPGAWWCAACRGDVERIAGDVCPKCLSADGSHDETQCDGILPFAGVLATGYYHSPPLRQAIGDLKFRGVTAIRDDLANYLIDAIADRHASFPWAEEPSIAIQPLPLTPSRERERGFNQSALVGQILRDIAMPGVPIVQSLSRVASRTPQANIEDHALRSANIRGAFVARHPGTDAVLLVDDVVTTGSTSGEAARALLGAGVRRVYLFALALGA